MRYIYNCPAASLELSLLTELSLQLLRLWRVGLELGQHLRHQAWLRHPQLLLLLRRHEEHFLLAARHHRGGGHQASAGAGTAQAAPLLGFCQFLVGSGAGAGGGAGAGARAGGGLVPTLLSGSHLTGGFQSTSDNQPFTYHALLQIGSQASIKSLEFLNVVRRVSD